MADSWVRVEEIIDRGNGYELAAEVAMHQNGCNDPHDGTADGAAHDVSPPQYRADPTKRRRATQLYRCGFAKVNENICRLPSHRIIRCRFCTYVHLNSVTGFVTHTGLVPKMVRNIGTRIVIQSHRE
jgi:hypothetical protein